MRINDANHRPNGNEIITLERMAEKGVATNAHYKLTQRIRPIKKLGFSIDDYPNAIISLK